MGRRQSSVKNCSTYVVVGRGRRQSRATPQIRKLDHLKRVLEVGRLPRSSWALRFCFGKPLKKRRVLACFFLVRWLISSRETLTVAPTLKTAIRQQLSLKICLTAAGAAVATAAIFAHLLVTFNLPYCSKRGVKKRCPAENYCFRIYIPVLFGGGNFFFFFLDALAQKAPFLDGWKETKCDEQRGILPRLTFPSPKSSSVAHEKRLPVKTWVEKDPPRLVWKCCSGKITGSRDFASHPSLPYIVPPPALSLPPSLFLFCLSERGLTEFE